MEQMLYVKNRDEWRAWLEKHHCSEKAIWLIYYKKHTGRERIPYDDAVEEAICFGWIDSIVKRIDEETFAQKFTPRTRKSAWSELNRKRAAKMISEGKMTEAGRSRISVAIPEMPLPQEKKKTSAGLSIPPFIARALSSNKKARAHFDKLAPSYKKLYIKWISAAKREETRQKRIEEALQLLEEGKKLGMK
jgi:uncharacterized protein YdeI (YjbR/CyaY-like superfamily)